MKKVLLTITSLTIGCVSTFAQTFYLNENLEGGALPAGWSQVTSATDGGFKFGTNTVLQSSYWPITAHTKFAATNDDACDCDKSNELLKTVAIDLSGTTQAFLKTDVYFQANQVSQAGALEEAYIEISTDSGATWTVLSNLTGDENWRTELVNIAAYTGFSDVMIGFRYKDKGEWSYGFAIDNVQVYEPYGVDASALTIDFQKYILKTNQSIAGTLKNFGSSTINTMTLNYSINNGSPVSEALTGLNIAPLTDYTYTHGTSWLPTVTGTHTLKVWASDINGSSDMNTINDTAYLSTYVADSLVQRKVLIEEYSSSTCGPCAAINPSFNAFLDQNAVNTQSGIVAAVKYQMDYPTVGDPAYTLEAETRHNYYGINGIPHAVMDGNIFSDHPAYLDQAMLDEQSQKPAVFKMNVSSTYAGSTVTITGNVTSYVNLSSTNLKLRVAIIEDHITHAPQSNGETEWFEVMRKMVPNPTGTSLAAQTLGTVTPINLSYTFGTNPQLFGTMEGLTIVAFIQDNVTKEIFQTAVANVESAASVSEISSGLNSFVVYPNPANDKAFVKVNVESADMATIAIYNAIGERVQFNETSLNSGINTVELNLDNLSTGVYYCTLTTSKGSVSKKITLVK